MYWGYSLSAKLKFQNGWAVAFKPFAFKSFRFDVDDNFPESKFRVNFKGELEENAEEVKWWNVKKMWETREFGPKANSQYFGLEHKFSDLTVISWSFKGDWLPGRGYASKIGIKFKEFGEKDTPQMEIKLGSSAWPYDCSSRAANGELRTRLGVTYAIVFPVAAIDGTGREVEYDSGMLIRTGITTLDTFNRPTAADIMFGFAPGQQKPLGSVSFQLRKFVDSIKASPPEKKEKKAFDGPWKKLNEVLSTPRTLQVSKEWKDACMKIVYSNDLTQKDLEEFRSAAKEDQLDSLPESVEGWNTKMTRCDWPTKKGAEMEVLQAYCENRKAVRSEEAKMWKMANLRSSAKKNTGFGTKSQFGWEPDAPDVKEAAVIAFEEMTAIMTEKSEQKYCKLPEARPDGQPAVSLSH